MVDYKIISAVSLAELEKKVQVLLKKVEDGWEALGAPFRDNENGSWNQAMVVYDEVEE